MDYNDYDDGPLTPADTESPGVTPSNDWWSRAQAAVGNVIDAAGTRAATQIATPTGTLSSNVRNFPPNSRGRNFQAGSTPGGAVQPFSWQSLSGNPVALVIVAALAVAAGVAVWKAVK